MNSPSFRFLRSRFAGVCLVVGLLVHQPLLAADGLCPAPPNLARTATISATSEDDAGRDFGQTAEYCNIESH
jgi:hypothetical protein